MISKLIERYGDIIESPFSIEINGKVVVFDSLVKGYGAAKGMIVDSSWDKISPYTDVLFELGYGYSCFELEDSDVEGFEEVLSEWGKQSA